MGLSIPFIDSHPTAASGVNTSPTRRQPVRAAHGNPHKRDVKKTAVPSVKSSPHVGVRLHLWGSKRRTWKGLENTTTSPSPSLPPLPTGKPCRIALYVQALADGLVHPGCRARPRRQLGGSKAMNESVVMWALLYSFPVPAKTFHGACFRRGAWLESSEWLHARGNIYNSQSPIVAGFNGLCMFWMV